VPWLEQFQNDYVNIYFMVLSLIKSYFHPVSLFCRGQATFAAQFGAAYTG
jgi:hypothetical protein